MGTFSYDRYDTRRRPAKTGHSVLGYWVPLFVTATLAVGGIAAWAWSAREDHDTSSDSDDEHLSYGGETDHEAPGRDGRRPPSYGVSEGVIRDNTGTSTGRQGATGEIREDTTLLGRVSSTIRRTPSPQQIFDGASKKVVAGVAAAGAAMGGALSAIREEDKDDFRDHERWREETAVAASRSAEAGKRAAGSSSTGARKRTVAIVVSAEEGDIPLEEEESRGWKSEHASLLSHIPPVNPATTNLVILIYAPRYQQNPAATGGSLNPLAPSSLASSYSAINAPGQTPAEELTSLDPMPTTPALSARSSGSSFYDLLYRQATRLVSTPVAIMPFSTPMGHVHMLKHIGPDVAYIVDSLSGSKGQVIEQIRGWVGQVVVVIGGDGAGLVDDTEDEMAGESKTKWWDGSDMVGLGKGVEVVDGVRVGDDWERRISGKE